jgi:hypothetical protein
MGCSQVCSNAEFCSCLCGDALMVPPNAPDWQIRAAEIAENLVRKELSKDERAAHTLLYAAELKASGKCASMKEAQKAGGKVAGKGRSADNRSQPAGGNLSTKPTTTQATATGVGISTNAVEKRVKAAAKAAGSAPVSIEKDTPEKLRELGAKALEQAQKGKGKAAHHAPPQRAPEPEEPAAERAAGLIAALDQCPQSGH